jgi:hypothetical protein
MINRKELKEKSNEWILNHIEKFKMMSRLYLTKEESFKNLYIVHLLECEYSSRQRISNENN